MCRLLGYLGPVIQLDSLLLEPPHSLVVQAYAPKELEVAKLNADGFGMGWYHPTQATRPFTYRNILPIWNDVNLESMCRYITTGCALAYVRSATPGQGVDISNCQPFQQDNWLFTHNGYIQQFHTTLYQPMRQAMSDRASTSLRGSTDSEHIWGLLLSSLLAESAPALETALEIALKTLMTLAHEYNTPVAANVLASDGKKLVGARLASHRQAPSLYWLRDNSRFPGAVLVASEPLFDGDWMAFPDSSLFIADIHCDVQFRSLRQLDSSHTG
ncbi:MAG: ergothioneine biosynthesis protein EgtC [Leptolyngbya sp. SIO1D8]|nr:ergothioneine biosynthesis protein EgtC [Leptolyngbya sp. SIO1D8]